MTELDATWVVVALGLSVIQVVLLAWRWRFTARRLGIDLPLRTAVREYYLGILLNQILPGGISGDLSRAWRQSRTAAPTGPAVRAVFLERASGQVIMTTTALLSLLVLPIAGGVTRGVAVAGVFAVAGVAMVVWVRTLAPGSLASRVWADTREALLLPSAFPLQLSTGVLATVSYIAMYLVAARAIGIEAGIVSLLPLVAPVLMTMLIPITVAGWGIREAAAAALWGFVGLTPEDGVAISVAYGLLVLVSSAPGIPVLMRTVTEGRSRRGRPAPEGSGGTADAAPHRETRSDRA